MTIAEIEAGIAKSAREGASRKAGLPQEWLETLIHLYRARILPFDLAAARVTGSLSDAARGRGHTAGFADLAIAATAKRHGLTILASNLKHYAALGVPAQDPMALVQLD